MYQHPQPQQQQQQQQPPPPPPPPPPPTIFEITINDDGNGTANASMNTAGQGTTVNISAVPRAGYVFHRWRIVSGNVRLLNNTGTTSFLMPNEAVIIMAEFSPSLPPPPPPATSNRTPFNSEIIRLIRRNNLNIDGLVYYLSSNITIKIDEEKKNAVVVINNDGSIKISDNPTNSKEIEYNSSMRGILQGNDNDREFLILFGENPLLLFQRVVHGQSDFFQLKSVLMLNNETYSVVHDRSEIPRLMINAIDDRNDTTVTPGNSLAGFTTVTPPNDNNQQLYEFNPRVSPRPNREILGQSSINRNGVINYVRSINRSVDVGFLGRLYDSYASEARIEGVNLDIAIAQMLRATNYLRNNRIGTRNYAGLEPVGRFNGTFPDMPTGVRAHIQHLKGYASIHLENQDINPRRFVLIQQGHLGQITSLNDRFFITWAGNSAADYRRAIDNILNELYRYSGI